MEQVGRLIPVDPHTAQVVAKKVVERVSRKERQAVRDPVRLIGVVVIIGFGLLPQISNRFGSLLVRS